MSEDVEIEFDDLMDKNILEFSVADIQWLKGYAHTFYNFQKEQEKEIEQLKRQIKIKNKYCQLIYDIGFDYDGYERPDDLKMIIDELVSYSIDAINSDDKKVMYEDSNGIKSNILMEEINE